MTHRDSFSTIRSIAKQGLTVALVASVFGTTGCLNRPVAEFDPMKVCQSDVNPGRECGDGDDAPNDPEVPSTPEGDDPSDGRTPPSFPDRPEGDDVGPPCERYECSADGKKDLELATPKIAVLVDRSGSMDRKMGDEDDNRWDVLKNALTDPSSGLITELSGKAELDVSLYNNPGHRNTDFGECVSLEGVSAEQLSSIRVDDSTAGPNGSTPTGEALLELVAQYPEDERPDAIVLATDGRPDSCKDDDENNIPAGMDETDGQRVAKEAAERVYAEYGIPVFVVGVDTKDIADKLEEIATAGGGDYVTAESQDQLVGAIRTSVEKVAACYFDITTAFDASADDFKLFVGGVETADWAWDTSGDRIKILGDACDQIASGDDVTIELTATCGCEEESTN